MSKHNEESLRESKLTPLLSRLDTPQNSEESFLKDECLRPLLGIGKLVTSTARLDQVLTYVLDSAITLIKAETGSLFLSDRRTNDIFLRARKGPADVHAQELRERFDDNCASEVLGTKKPLRLTSKDRHLRFSTGLFVNSVLYVPMTVRGEAIGVLSVANQTPDRPFTEADEATLCILADYAAIAVQNARLTRAMHEISEVIDSESTLETVTGRILDELGKIVGYRKSCVQLIRSQNEKRELITNRGFGAEEIDEWLLRPISEDQLVYDIVNRERPGPRILSDLSDPARHADLKWEVRPSTEDVKSWIGLPLVVRGQVIGMMTLDHDQAGYYTDALEEALILFGGQAASAIEQARRSDGLKLLHNINSRIAQAQAVDQTLQEIVDGAMQLINASAGVIYLVDAVRLSPIAQYSHPGDFHTPPRLRNPKGITRTVMATGKTMIFPDITEDTEENKRVNPGLSQHYRSMIAVPLRLKEKVIGVLFLNTKEKHIFNETEQSWLSTLAAQAAIAVDKARLLEAEHRQRTLTEALINSSPVATIAADHEGKITHFNGASERITGYKRNEILGQDVHQLDYEGEEEARRISHALFESEKQGRPVKDLRAVLRGKQGERIPVRLTGTTLYDESGKKTSWIVLVTDLREIEVLDREYRGQQDLLARLEHYPQNASINNLGDLREQVTSMLEMIRQFCRLNYAIFFASTKEDETVLQAVAWAGLPPEVEDRPPHFNWKKARLQQPGDDRVALLRQEAELIAKWWPDALWRERIATGIRGDHADFFEDMSCGVPIRLADNYRAVLVFGSFNNFPDLASMVDFVRSISQSVGTNALSWLQTLYLRSQRVRLERSAQLIVHRSRMKLLGITGKFGVIKKNVSAGSTPWLAADEGEQKVTALSDVIVRALTSETFDLEPEDLHFEQHSLSALVQNCVDGFVEKSKSEGRELRVDDTIEYLPFAEVDSALLSVALGNLIDNAVKYSFEGSYIPISAKIGTRAVQITVQDFGEPLPEDARGNLVEPGKRWGMSPRARRIPGTGYGLWEASVIVVAHGGKLDFSCVEHRPRQGRPGHLVRVWMILPLKRDHLENLSQDGGLV